MTAAAINTILAPTTAPSCEISYLPLCDRGSWNSYVNHHPYGSFFHLFEWGETIRAAYGYEPLYLAARRGGDIVGLALLIDVRSPLLGRSLVSTAFTVGGGPIGDDTQIVEALACAAAAEGAARGVDYVEFRNECPQLAGWESKDGKYASFQMPIPADEAENLSAIPRKRRAELRKAFEAEKAGDLRIRVETDVGGFYALYAKSLNALGTPIFPKRFVRELVGNFGDAVEITFVEYRGETVAALLSFYFKDAVLPYYVGAAPSARKVRAFDLIYWSQMRRAAARQTTIFDFGRSKIGSGSYDYKKHWGVEPKPLSYQYKLVAARTAPDINPNNPKFKYFVRAWKFLPLPVANILGPLLAPNFP
jgi:FemAB-related protein (PEP-CTERM system-associated)